MQFRKISPYLIEKKALVKLLLYAGFLLAYYGSLSPWFLWPLGGLFPIPVCFCFGFAYLLDRSLDSSCRIFTRQDYLLPFLLSATISFYMIITGFSNINGVILTFFHVGIFLCIFRVDIDFLQRVLLFITKTMGVLLLFSIVFFFLYLLGFPLPNRNAEYTEFYSFTNYYLFLLDDRSLFTIIPRFQSVFLEPTYLGSACAVLLQFERGNWKKWYNLVLLFSIFISFSLAGYAYLIAIIFLNLWTNRKKIFKKIALSILSIAMVIGGAFVYNGGDNLLHDLILLRLEVEDGEMAGNNRTSEGFDVEFEKYLDSTDIVFGRDKEVEFGDSGYKVFIYEYGFVGLFLLIAFYYVAFRKAPETRAKISAWVVALLIFGVDAFVLWNYRFIPLLCTAYRSNLLSPQEPTQELLNDLSQTVPLDSKDKL